MLRGFFLSSLTRSMMLEIISQIRQINKIALGTLSFNCSNSSFFDVCILPLSYYYSQAIVIDS